MSVDGKAPASCRTPTLFLGGAVEDDADFFERDEAAVDHFVEAGKNFFDALPGIDDIEDDVDTFVEAGEVFFLVHARARVADHASQRRRPSSGRFFAPL